MTVKELKEKLECLIEEGNGGYKILIDLWYGIDDLFELDESDIRIFKEDREVWL